MGCKVSDARSPTAHKTHPVPEILVLVLVGGLINTSGIPVGTAAKLRRPSLNPSCKNIKNMDNPDLFRAAAANGTLSSGVSALKDQRRPLLCQG